jgi:alpha-galactosidase
MTFRLQTSAATSPLLELLVERDPVSSAIPFEVSISGQVVDLKSALRLSSSPTEATATAETQGVQLDWRAVQLSNYPVWEFRLSATNISSGQISLSRLDSAALGLQGGVWRVESFASAWGDEFRPKAVTTQHDSFFGVRSGRSSHGESPIIYFIRESDGYTVIVSPAWSGNWHVDVFSGGVVKAGISTWNLNLSLEPNETVHAPGVIVAAAESKEVAQRNLQSAIRENWLPRTKSTDSISVEWNHWWPYEDVEVNADVIIENAQIAKNMAIDAIVVDAGWFGESKLDTHWTDLRGDWSSINLARFPDGLAKLGESILEMGMSPGIWIELEAVGAKSELRRTMPEAMARDDSGLRPDPSYRVGTVSLDPTDPGFLGYVCLGSPAGWTHSYNSVKDVVSEMKARWLKMDFNIDPGFGCTRTDHGHRAGDGLLRHYEGLYKLLDQIRLDFPDLLIEACSSGGLRVDLGLAKHVHCFFMSDPDYTEHHLQVLWGATHMLPPLAILHWPWSWWRNDYGPSQLDWMNVDIETFDLMMRAAMFHRIGVSYPLPKLPAKLRDRLSYHLQIFKDHIAPVLPTANLISLTDSPFRGNRGERNSVWQLSSNLNSVNEVHLVLSLKLENSAHSAKFRPTQLDDNQRYVVVDLETHNSSTVLGRELTGELLSEIAGNKNSWIVEIRPEKANL